MVSVSEALWALADDAGKPEDRSARTRALTEALPQIEWTARPNELPDGDGADGWHPGSAPQRPDRSGRCGRRCIRTTCKPAWKPGITSGTGRSPAIYSAASGIAIRTSIAGISRTSRRARRTMAG